MEIRLHVCYKINWDFSKTKKKEERTLMSSRSGSFDPYDYHVSKYGKKCLRERNIHS